MADFFNDGTAMQLAGFAILGGANPGQAMGEALTQSALIRQQEMHAAEMERQQKAIQNLAAALPGIKFDIDNPDMIIKDVVSKGGTPDQALTLLKAIAENSQERRLIRQQQMTERYLSGELGAAATPAEPSAAMPDNVSSALQRYNAATLTGNPLLIGNAKTQLDLAVEQQKLDEQRAYDEKRKIAEREYEANEKPLSGESAAKVALARQGSRGIEQVRQLAFDKDGNIRRDLIAQVTEVPVVGSIQLTPEAKKLYNALYTMSAAKLRLDTGANAPDAEVRANLKAFAPSLIDDGESANYKLDELKFNFQDYADLMGKSLPPKSGTAPAKGNGPIPKTTAPAPDVTKLSDQELMQLLQGAQ